MKEIKESEKDEVYQKERQKRLGDKVPHPKVESLKTKMSINNTEELDWDSVSDI